METIKSEALGKDLTIRITASCMRTIKKCGGLDQYLLGDKPARIKELGLFGWKLRWQIMNTARMREKFAKERKNLGLPPSTSMEPLLPFEQAWEDQSVRDEMLREQKEAWEALKEKEERFVAHVKTKWEPRDKREYTKDLDAIVKDPNSVLSLSSL